MSQEKCPRCGSGEIVESIRCGLTAETGSFGLKYKTAMILVGTEPMLADLCAGCGTITRFHVRNTDRKWAIA